VSFASGDADNEIIDYLCGVFKVQLKSRYGGFLSDLVVLS
jgi:hypothetical protein